MTVVFRYDRMPVGTVTPRGVVVRCVICGKPGVDSEEGVIHRFGGGAGFGFVKRCPASTNSAVSAAR